jgi:hypothetical protein
MKFDKLRKRMREVLLIILGIVIATSVSVVIESLAGGNEITACANNQTGDVRIVESSADCRPSEHLEMWNIQGPEGPPGPQGPQGSPGPQGPTEPQGPAGISGYEIVFNSSSTNSDKFKDAVVVCPAGKRVLGGGAAIGSPDDNVAIQESRPSGDNAWEASATELDVIYLAGTCKCGQFARMSVRRNSSHVTPRISTERWMSR